VIPIEKDFISFLDFLEFEKRYSPNTIVSYQQDLQQFADFLSVGYESLKLEDINSGIIRTWLASLAESGLSHRSLSRKTACLKSFFKFHKKNGRDFKDPMLGINSPKFPKKLPEFISDRKMDKLFDGDFFPKGFEGVRDFLVLELLYGTGMRLSELINIKDEFVDFKKCQVKITGKGNKQRIVPLNPNLISAIKKYFLERDKLPFEKSQGLLILTNKGNKAYPMFIQRIVKKYLSLITTAEKISPHLLRHSFATSLLNHGADLNAIKDLLGHESLAATQVYTHNSVEKLKKIFNQAHPKA
jgi:integrase/recombinase XerC